MLSFETGSPGKVAFAGLAARGEVWCQPGKRGFVAPRCFVPRIEAAKLLFAGKSSAERWKEQLLWLQRKSWYKVRAFRKGKEKNNPCMPHAYARVYLHARA